jgi:hypothetical protein
LLKVSHKNAYKNNAAQGWLLRAVPASLEGCRTQHSEVPTVSLYLRTQDWLLRAVFSCLEGYRIEHS